jgi:hypothetical protein
VKNSQLRFILFLLFGLALTLSATGCNFFGGIDHPSGDNQLISAALACLDQGDFQCAITDFQGLSGASSDIEQSGLAYAEMDQAGANMGAFGGAFGNGKNISFGPALTSMANSILASGAGQSARLAIFTAFSHQTAITDNPHLQALVQFLGAISFAAEILAEAAQIEGTSQLLKTDLVTNPGCTLLTCAPVALSNINGGNLPDGKTSLTAEANASTTAGITGAPTLGMFNAALMDMSTAIQNIGSTGNLATISQAFATGLTAATGSNATYLFGMISVGVGN